MWASASAEAGKSSNPEPGSHPGIAAASLRQAFLVERLLCEADAAEVPSAMHTHNAPDCTKAPLILTAPDLSRQIAVPGSD